MTASGRFANLILDAVLNCSRGGGGYPVEAISVVRMDQGRSWTSRSCRYDLNFPSDTTFFDPKYDLVVAFLGWGVSRGAYIGGWVIESRSWHVVATAMPRICQQIRLFLTPDTTSSDVLGSDVKARRKTCH